MTCSDEGRVAEVSAVLADGRVEVLAGGQAEQVDGRLVEACGRVTSSSCTPAWP